MPEGKEKTLEDIFRNKLKNIDTTNLERIIAEAVGQVLDINLVCSIGNIEYEPSFFTTHAKMSLSLHAPTDTNFSNKTEA